MTEEQIRAVIDAAIAGVTGEARPLNFRRAQERAIAHRLALHMEPHFRGDWDIDCEYDRDGLIKKTLEGLAGCGGRKTDEFLPDIIVHHREGQGRDHNLLAIEIKKDAVENPCDRLKLELLTDPQGHYAYQLGLYINVDDGRFGCAWYKDGRQLRTTPEPNA